MIGSTALQSAYNDLYKELRKYIWSFDAVNAIADLEIASYEAIADIPTVQKCLDQVRAYSRGSMKDDEELAKAFEKFDELLKDQDSVYVKLLSVKEEISDESIKKPESESGTKSED